MNILDAINIVQDSQAEVDDIMREVAEEWMEPQLEILKGWWRNLPPEKRQQFELANPQAVQALDNELKGGGNGIYS